LEQITVGGFVGLVLGICLLIFCFLFYYRLKIRYGWFQTKVKKKDTFIEVFIKANLFGESNNNNAKVEDISTIENSASFSLDKKDSLTTHKQDKDDKKKDFAELRKSCRLTDQDMPNHACRINLLGSNSPFSSRGT
jgi:hypothetical protein